MKWRQRRYFVRALNDIVVWAEANRITKGRGQFATEFGVCHEFVINSEGERVVITASCEDEVLQQDTPVRGDYARAKRL